jgi:FkbM family methyltransferase
MLLKRRMLSFVFRNYRINKFLIQNVPPEHLRLAVGREYLSPIQCFALDGYSDALYRNLDLNQDCKVVVLGGYIGNSVSSILEYYSCEIHVLEPASEYFKVLQSRFHKIDSIFLYQVAASNFDGEISLSLDGEKTGIFQETNEQILVPCVNISDFVSSKVGSVDLLEINIEGGEYSVLANLIETKQILNCRTLLVQFHRYRFEQNLERELIRSQLSLSHELIKNYEWVWEVWELRNSN